MGKTIMHTTNGTSTHNGHEYVDLGLPSGTLWATCNVGATSPEKTGLYFAFGETTGFTAEQVEKGVRKFDSASYTAPSVSGNLTLEQDAAHVNLGGNWLMPKQEDFEELITNCAKKWVGDYKGTGVSGRLFTSMVNGNSVFFPDAGYCDVSSVYCVGSCGYYSSAEGRSSYEVWYFYFNCSYQYVHCITRYYGFPVRGVCKR